MKHIRIFSIALAALLTLGACQQKAVDTAEEPVADNIYQFCVVDGMGDTVSLANYAGQVLLVVNTATQCGFTPQNDVILF